MMLDSIKKTVTALLLILGVGLSSLAFGESRSEAPVLKRSSDIVFTGRLASVEGELSADMRISIDAEGRVLSVAVVETSDPEFARLLQDEIRTWRYRPAMRDGQPIPATIGQRFLHNVGGRVQEQSARLEVDVMPVAQRSVVALGGQVSRSGFALVSVRVGVGGTVLSAEAVSSSDRKFATACEEAALGWRFRPALKDGEPVEATLVLPFFQ